jgi:hypothetical protein
MAWLAAAAAWTAASLFAAALAIVFAATVAVIAVMASGFMVIATVALRARRAARNRSADPDLIEAHHVGGHSWVAYGWDGRS